MMNYQTTTHTVSSFHTELETQRKTREQIQDLTYYINFWTDLLNAQNLHC